MTETHPILSVFDAVFVGIDPADERAEFLANWIGVLHRAVYIDVLDQGTSGVLRFHTR